MVQTAHRGNTLQSCIQGQAEPAGSIDHFTVLSSMTWALNRSEAGGDLALIQTSRLLSCKCTYLA